LKKKWDCEENLMYYTNTLILGLLILLVGFILFKFYRFWFEKETSLVLSGTKKKVRVPRFELVKKGFVILSISLISFSAISDTIFLPYNRCSNFKTSKSVQQWEARFGTNPAYDLCYCAQGYPVFKDPSRAFTQLILDNPKGILLMNLHYVIPLTRYSAGLYANYYNGAEYPTKDPETIKQLDRIKTFLDLFENSYNKNLDPLDQYGNPTTLNGVLSFQIIGFKGLDYVYLPKGEKKEAPEGKTYLYVYYAVTSLIKTNYEFKSEAITFLQNQHETGIVSTIDQNQKDKDGSGIIEPQSVVTGLVVAEVDQTGSSSLLFLDGRIAAHPFEFPID